MRHLFSSVNFIDFIHSFIRPKPSCRNQIWAHAAITLQRCDQLSYIVQLSSCNRKLFYKNV
jgi:hypothetical protein